MWDMQMLKYYGFQAEKRGRRQCSHIGGVPPTTTAYSIPPPPRATTAALPHNRSSPSPSRSSTTPPNDSRRSSFPSYLDVPNLPSKIRLICEIIASSHSIESSLNDQGITITSDDVEEVLKLSYSHPAAAIKFFRWSGPRIRQQLSPYSWNLVVDLLGKNLLFDAMWDAVASMKSEGLVSLATFASIFSSFAAASCPADAIDAFELLAHHGIPQDTTALNFLLSALSRGGFTYAALESFRHMRLRIPPDSDSYAILLEGFENERNSARAYEVFDEMILKIGWDPSNVPAYDSFLNTVLYRGRSGLDESLRWLATMKMQRCFPGVRFIDNAIDACAELGDSKAAILLWDNLVGRNGMLPTTELFNSMISLYCNLNHLEHAYRLFDEMVFHGAFPDSTTYELMLRLLIKNKRREEVAALLSEMVKNEFVPSSEIFDSVMSLFMDIGDSETALKVGKIMIEKGILDERIGNSLILYLRDNRRLPEACKFAENMIDKGIKLHSSTLSKLRTGLQHLGMIL
ncbi:pentatricopeptide repeat-containing protein At1g77360, mitochondrial-like [Phalaenopsis equestris]|uniref:pentatricopeptide repeat-containing protein At1g77360, mitochondrial-like n=1 Tax=Phalaenopsis equestris TaxID=78828 RepID=UPI0009E3BD69|nr:pentatricopeptide repeat-containing protein At1g77360, mitochondrial-like [Phalaenopsis equestris]